MSDVALDERTDPVLDEGDRERFAHIIRKSDEMRAYVMGEEVLALCGKRWIPSRDPQRFPVCPECKAALTMLRGGGGSGGDSR